MFNSFKRKGESGLVSSRNWLNGNSIYQGFPIYFRRLDIDRSEYKVLAAQYPVQVAITHYLRKVKDNGLPEPEYNRSLAEFDHCLINLFHERDIGIAFLIETLAAKRTYYFYAQPDYEDSQLKEFQRHFDGEKIEWAIDLDPTWATPHMYATDFFFK